MTYFVIGNAYTGSTPFVLQLDGHDTLSKAQSAIHWQREGQGQFDPADYWQVCMYSSERGGFQPIQGTNILKPGRHPYTEKAWAEFCERTGYKGA